MTAFSSQDIESSFEAIRRVFSLFNNETTLWINLEGKDKRSSPMIYFMEVNKVNSLI